jgi:cyclophilin family peptidyl-prolyl cis-trans isomerase
MHRGGARIVTAYNRLQNLPKAHQKQVQETIDRLTAEGAARVDKGIEAFQAKMLVGPHPQVLIETSCGPIKAELYDKLAPATVANFLEYVDDKFYDGTVFHRVMPEFMIQGGGFEPGLKEKPTRPPIKNEAANLLPNKVGTLAMARTSVADSATSQFFINVVDNKALDRRAAQDKVGYAVFGKVIEGMDAVSKIKAVATTTLGPHADVPKNDVVIKSIRRLPAPAAAEGKAP